MVIEQITFTDFAILYYFGTDRQKN